MVALAREHVGERSTGVQSALLLLAECAYARGRDEDGARWYGEARAIGAVPAEELTSLPLLAKAHAAAP